MLQLYLRVTAFVIIAIWANTNVARGNDLLELGCTDAHECKHFELESQTNATCSEGTCSCFEIATQKRITCRPKENKVNNIIGGECPCGFDNSDCLEGKCYCKPDYTASVDRRRCLPTIVSLNATCEQDSQCQLYDSFAKCNASTNSCQCSKGFMANEGVCASILALKMCSKNEDCEHGSGAECAGNSTCVCGKNYIANPAKSRCLDNLNYNQSCSDAIECKAKLGLAANCVANKCQCENNFYPNSSLTETRCLPPKKFGQYCRTNTDCWEQRWSVEQQRMKCVYGECHCISSDYKIVGDYCQFSKGLKLDFNQLLLIFSFLYIVKDIF